MSGGLNHAGRVRALESDAAAMETTADLLPSGNVIDFIVDGLGTSLYPVQAALAKVITAGDDLFTDADREVLAELKAGYADTDGDHYVGERGTTSDLDARLEHVRATGRWSFRRVVLVAGRRSSKTHLSAVLLLWLVWRLIRLGDPHRHFGVRRRKPLTIFVMSTNLAVVQRDAFADIRALAEDSRWLRPFIVSIDDTRIEFATPRDLRSRRKVRRGSIVIEACPATAHSVRGAAVVGALLDEAAFLEGQGSTSTGEEIMAALAPATAQFAGESLVIVASSPAGQEGGFYDLHQQACAIDPTTGAAASPDTLMIHLRSWDMYFGWDRAHELEMYPEGPRFPRLQRAIIERDSPEIADARAHSEAVYRREYLAEWASGLHPFMPAHVVDRMFAPWEGRTTVMTTSGDPHRYQYHAHIDPSSTRDNMAFVIAHRETHNRRHHAVFDFMHAFTPASFGGEIRYRELVPLIVDVLERFGFPLVTIDTYQGHALAEWLTEEIEARRGRAFVTVVHANMAEKRDRWEYTLDQAADGNVHLPPHSLARRELMALRDDGHRIQAPTTGPTKTDDLADTTSWIVIAVLRGQQPGRKLSGLRIGAGPLDWGPNPYAGTFSAARVVTVQPPTRNPRRSDPLWQYGFHYRRRGL